MQNKVVYVPSKFKVIKKMVKERIPTGKKEKILFFENEIYEIVETLKEVGYSDCEIDGEQFSKDIEIAIKNLNEEGYKVLNITPIISGSHYHKTKFHEKSGAGYGYGYSYTDGVSIVAEKADNDVLGLNVNKIT